MPESTQSYSLIVRFYSGNKRCYRGSGELKDITEYFKRHSLVQDASIFLHVLSPITSAGDRQSEEAERRVTGDARRSALALEKLFSGLDASNTPEHDREKFA